MTLNSLKIHSWMLGMHFTKLFSSRLFQQQMSQSAALLFKQKKNVQFVCIAFRLCSWLTFWRLEILFYSSGTRKHIWLYIYETLSTRLLKSTLCRDVEASQKQFCVFKIQHFEKTSLL